MAGDRAEETEDLAEGPSASRVPLLIAAALGALLVGTLIVDSLGDAPAEPAEQPLADTAWEPPLVEAQLADTPPPEERPMMRPPSIPPP